VTDFDDSYGELEAFALSHAPSASLYPLTALLEDGSSVRLNVKLARAGGQNSGASATGLSQFDAVAEIVYTHRGFTPPGVRLTPGQRFTTNLGERFEVVNPITRNTLGDTVSLSFLGDA